jgi:hypothetical protein
MLAVRYLLKKLSSNNLVNLPYCNQRSRMEADLSFRSLEQVLMLKGLQKKKAPLTGSFSFFWGVYFLSLSIFGCLCNGNSD